MQTRFFIICEAAVASICAALLVARLAVGSFPVSNVVGMIADALLFVGSGGVALLGVVRRRQSRRAARLNLGSG
jgi:hypothetical protein